MESRPRELHGNRLWSSSGLDGAEVVECEGVRGVDLESPLEQGLGGREVEASQFRVAVVAEQVGVCRRGGDGGFEVVIGGTLYSDAMGGAGSGADSYVGMVESNVNTIVGALR